MTRANRVAVQTTENGFEARFYRTHKHICTVASVDTTWKEDIEANATTNREAYRTFVCDHAEEFGVIWNPAKAEQAWERKHNIYMTDEEVAEDAITLVAPAIDRLADKSRYDMVVVDIEMTGIAPKESNLSYVEDGRYTKSGAWCVADIEITVGTIIGGKAVAILYNMEMRSGQICKSKTTIAEWNEMVAKELELQGIVIEENAKTA